MNMTLIIIKKYAACSSVLVFNYKYFKALFPILTVKIFMKKQDILSDISQNMFVLFSTVLFSLLRL